ncbi:hypothetical protein [Aquibium microcysteis]|uniref:hypothetical protein n=1 Tax=Aquibium microcysteis TaxID=675281 RepID=UPI00165CFC61|nr:hypothetical protein [Aquibium microcysteis]
MMRLVPLPTLILGAMAAWLSGCSSLSPGAAVNLAGFDPFSADPAALAVAVRSTRALRLRTGDVSLRIALAADDPAEAFDETLRLAIVEGADVAGIPVEPERRERVHVASVAKEDRARLAAIQARVRAYKARAEPRGRGTLAIGVSGGCRDGELDAESARLATFMRTDEGRPFFPLTREQPLMKALEGVPLDHLPPCPDAG